jgi:hypothetical protein
VGEVEGSVRLQLKAPETAYRWPDGQPPYCLGASTPGFPKRGPEYTFPQPGYYQFIGDSGGVLAQQVSFKWQS